MNRNRRSFWAPPPLGGGGGYVRKRLRRKSQLLQGKETLPLVKRADWEAIAFKTDKVSFRKNRELLTEQGPHRVTHETRSSTVPRPCFREPKDTIEKVDIEKA